MCKIMQRCGAKQKLCYPNEEDAKRRARVRGEKAGVKLRAYFCVNCAKWHLTSMRKEER